MKLIKKLDSRFYAGKKRLFGLFFCPFCCKKVEKPIEKGKKQKSCGCGTNLLISKHNGSSTRIYRIWLAMKSRCYNPNNERFKRYGERGIIVCDEWKNDFIKFRDWAIQNGYDDNFAIDRINGNSNYEPNNCRFVTAKENNRNKDNVISSKKAIEIKILLKAKKHNHYQISEITGCKLHIIRDISANRTWGDINV